MPNGEWLVKQAENDLREISLDEYIEQRLNKGLIGFNHPIFSDHAARQKEQDDYVLNPYEVEEGVITCIKCKGKKVFSTVIQNRAADEPMTTVAHCVLCKTKWTQNG